MSKENIRTLLERYQSGDCTEREKKLVHQWFATLDKEIPQRTDQHNSELEERIWTAIQGEAQSAKPSRLISLWKYAAAAVVILALAWGGYQYKSGTDAVQTAKITQGDNLLSFTNSTKTPQSYTLPDGSKVILAPRSVMAYKPDLQGITRDVFLTGKAFFEVTKNPGRPFLVHTGEVITKVLGTSFWVDGKKNLDAVEVSVVSGKVSVSQKDHGPASSDNNLKDGVILTPNQKVRYTTQTHTFETGLVINPVPIVPKKVLTEELFIFQDVPVTQVIQKLEKSYGIEIILETDDLNGCLFKGNLTHQPLFTKLDMLCTSINANYEVRGTRILISGKGCSTDHFNQ